MEVCFCTVTSSSAADIVVSSSTAENNRDSSDRLPNSRVHTRRLSEMTMVNFPSALCLPSLTPFPPSSPSVPPLLPSHPCRLSLAPFPPSRAPIPALRPSPVFYPLLLLSPPVLSYGRAVVAGGISRWSNSLPPFGGEAYCKSHVGGIEDPDD